jgi:hypothetical protein
MVIDVPRIRITDAGRVAGSRIAIGLSHSRK